jgi:hypothetical protein
MSSLRAVIVRRVAARKNIATVIILEWNVGNTVNVRAVKIVRIQLDCLGSK